MTQKKSRHIPKSVSDEVQKRHFFECAWCGVHLTERHHITEFHKEGEHTIENLILLCPNCHTIVHNGGIPAEELILRKSNHKKCDRLMGNLKTTLNSSKMVMGTDTLLNCRYLISVNYFPILDVIVKNENLLIHCSFFNRVGDLIFWMNGNYYWSEVDAVISSKLDFLEISNPDDDFYFRIKKENDYLRIDIKTFLFGNIFHTGENGVFYSNGKYRIFSAGNFFENDEDCYFLPNNFSNYS
jgi:hypothetical protein